MAVRTVHGLPEELSLEQHLTTALGWGLIAFCSSAHKSLSFIRILLATSNEPIERWDIPPFPFNFRFLLRTLRTSSSPLSEKRNSQCPCPVESAH